MWIKMIYILDLNKYTSTFRVVSDFSDTLYMKYEIKVYIKCLTNFITYVLS